MSKLTRGTTTDANRRRERHARKKRDLLSGGMVRVRRTGRRTRHVGLEEMCLLRDLSRSYQLWPELILCACCECGYLRMGAHHPGIRCPKSGRCGECGNDWPCSDHAWMAKVNAKARELKIPKEVTWKDLTETFAQANGISPPPKSSSSKARKAGG
jgi:hypothetical protein